MTDTIVTTTDTTDPAELRTAAAQTRRATRARELLELLEARPDLAGIYAPADFAAEAVRWSA
jgi:2-oxo-4-hydroxy-4-carboxy--5-ureidoimidazoline (OHCU) decarboxylase